MTGSQIVKHTPDSHLGLGIRNLSFSPNTKQIACGLYDTNLVIYNNLTQSLICELEHKTSITLDTKVTRGQPDIFKEELARSEHGQVQMSSTNHNQLGYHYMNISAPSNPSQESTLHTIKIPQLSKKDQDFKTSTYETAKLKGPMTGI